MIFFNETFLSLPEKFSEGATHLLRGVQYFDPNFRECEFSVASVYVPVSSKRDVGGTEHGFARNLHVARRFAAVRRCSFRFERIGGGAARETEGNTCNEMPAFAPFALQPGRYVSPRERRPRSWEHSAVLHFSTKSAVNVPTDAPCAPIYDR